MSPLRKQMECTWGAPGRQTSICREASTGPFLRSIDITRYLNNQETAGRPVQANKEIHRLSRIFPLAKTRWGYTEYNPCLQVRVQPRDAAELALPVQQLFHA
jgi:hypothetical protein